LSTGSGWLLLTLGVVRLGLVTCTLWPSVKRSTYWKFSSAASERSVLFLTEDAESDRLE